MTTADIKSALRRFMNGDLAAQLRQRDMEYRLIFGIEIPRLRELAATLHADHPDATDDEWQQLAQALWTEDIRECRLMALLLMPADRFSPMLCDVWLQGILGKGDNSVEAAVELIDSLCMYLLRTQPYASDKAFAWIAAEPVLQQYAGYRLLTHLLRRGALGGRDLVELRDQATTAESSASPLLVLVARQALQMAEGD